MEDYSNKLIYIVIGGVSICCSNIWSGQVILFLMFDCPNDDFSENIKIVLIASEQIL